MAGVGNYSLMQWSSDGNNYGLTSLHTNKSQTDEDGFLIIALNKRKLTCTTDNPRNLGSRQTRIQRKSVLLPALQETLDATVLLEFMKIKFSKLHQKT